MSRRCLSSLVGLVMFKPGLNVASSSRCGTYQVCDQCLQEGCGWCSFVPGQGICEGVGDGEFACDAVFRTIPGQTCWNSSTSQGSGPGGGYDCDMKSGMCISHYMGPSAPMFTKLSSCINGCAPAGTLAPRYSCNTQTKQCEVAAAGGTSRGNCEAQCHDRKLCSGGQCISQGVDGTGDKECSGTCPQPAVGINCSSLTPKGCTSCVEGDPRCGWCPYYNSCYDIAPNAAIFLCPPGFTTDPSHCSPVDVTQPARKSFIV